MNTRYALAIILVLVMSLSVYFSAGAQAQSTSIGNLTLYHLGPDGIIVAAQNNLFTEGETIWLGAPQGSSPPYWVSIYDQNGYTISTSQGGSFSANNLLPVSLDPSSFAPNHGYRVVLSVTQTTLPGMSTVQSYTTSFAVGPAYGHLSSENFARGNGQAAFSVRLSDSHSNPETGVRLGLFLHQGAATLEITTEKTDSQGRASFGFAENLAAGTYQYEARVLDDGVSAKPLQLPQFTVGTRLTTLTTWPANGNLNVLLADTSSTQPVPGRLLVLYHELKDGNWTIVSTTYTDDNGRASFPQPENPWRVSFNGDTFYSSSTSDTFTSPPSPQPPASPPTPTGEFSTFVGTTFSNGHIAVKVDPATISIYDPQGHVLLGHLGWEIQELSADTWHSLQWDHPLTMGVDDVAGQHRVSLQGKAGNGSLAVSMYLIAKSQDALYTPLQMPVQLTATTGTHTYRLVWHLDTNFLTSFQFEQRTGDQRTAISGPITVGSSLDQSPAGENSLVALARDGKTVLLGLNWNNALQYYQGTSMAVTGVGASTSIRFGPFTVSSGQTLIVPACPCPDGGGGGGGGTINTTTTLYLPSSAYATITTVLKAQVKDALGNAVSFGSVNFYRDGSSIGTAALNSTGFASFPWTPNTTGSHSISATYPGNGFDLSSSAQQSLTINQTPTTIMILKPVTVAYSWDVYNYYNGFGRPIVIPVETLTLAATNNTGTGTTYVPTYNGNSTTPPHISGYGWAGLNQSAAVTVTFNSTYTQTQTMNWTRNFYMPPCTSPPFCSTTPRTGHIYFTASVSPPSTLYVASSTSLNIPYQNVNTATGSSSQLSQTATPPAHLYVKVNATYPYITVSMQGVPVALEAYTAYLAYTLGGPTSSSVQCPKSGCFNYYSLPVLSSIAGSDFAYLCASSGCATPAANVQVNLYNSKGQLCGFTTTDNQGIALIQLTGPKGCTYPYYYLGTTTTSVILSELFAIEARSSPNPFYTNFQGYNYAIYAPQQTGRYLLNMHVWYTQGSSFTVLYPSANYPDVQQAILTCCDVFLSVEKHPVKLNAAVTPGIATVVDNVNATISSADQAEHQPMPNVSLSYTLNRVDPSPTTVKTGTIPTNTNGNVTFNLGKLSYGNYTLTVSWAGNSTSNPANYQANFTIWKARTVIIISPGWIQQATVGNTYLFTTMLIDNATKSMIAVSGLLEQVYVNGALYSTTELCTTSGCSVANYYLTNPGGNATFPWTPTGPGQYMINATLPRQNYYPSATFVIEVSAKLRPAMIIATSTQAQPNTGDTVTWSIQAYDMMNNASITGLTITQYISGTVSATNTTDATGISTFKHVFPLNGFYNVTFVSTQTNFYNSARTQSILKVSILTSLTITSGTVYLGQQNTFTVNLKDANNNPLAGRTIQISLNSASYQTITTDSNGNAQFTWTPTALGSSTFNAKFSANGSQDTTYRPSSATLDVKIVAQKITNTDSTNGGTQSLTLPTASSSAQSGLLPSISISYPSLLSLKVTASFAGATVTGTVTAHITFSWACVVTVNTFFGSICLLVVPIVKTYVDMSLSGVVDFHVVSQLFGSVSISDSILGSVQEDLDAFSNGVDASGAIATVGGLVLYATEEPIFSGLVNILSMLLATLAGQLTYHWKTPALVSYLYGLMVPVILGLPCARFLICLPSLPPWMGFKGNPIPDVPAAILLWALYDWPGFFADIAIFSDPFVVIEMAAVILIPAVLIALQGSV